MTYDFKTSLVGAAADRFLAWFEAETVDELQRAYGDGDATKGTIFLYVNRAYESHMPERMIAEMFGKCIVRAGYREEDEEPASAWFESLAAIARKVHGGT